ncbi:MAG: 5-methylthioadenosine/S-adenosylhomocysteine deaminase [Calditrichaeota bacterium]|nr:5-methylthioadenosine/S-adenosylhomocysteine deaminase [Calditrichota bacterium]
MPTLLIKNALLDGERRNIYCEHGRIVAIDRQQRDADDVLDADGLLAHAPLINSHTHASMTLFRGNGDDLPLMEWLTTRVWPYERRISRDEVYWGAKLAILEMIRSGCVFFNDMYWDSHAVAQAVEEMGVRAMLSSVIIDITTSESERRRQMERIERQFDEVRQYSDRVQFAVGPHAIYTVSEEGFCWAAEFARAHGCVLHTHLSETEKEVKDCYDEHGCSPVEYLDRIGALACDLVAAHTIWLSDRDVALLGEHAVVCAHNPVSNMKLAVNGVYPYRRLDGAGAVTALATDGAGSNNNLDLFEEMKIAALLQKFHNDDPTALTATEALEMAAHNPAPFFNLDGREIAVGRRADLILIDLSLPELNPVHDIDSHFVYAANGCAVDSVVCDGKLLMKHRQVEGEEEIVAKANEAARVMFSRVDGA